MIQKLIGSIEKETIAHRSLIPNQERSFSSRGNHHDVHSCSTEPPNGPRIVPFGSMCRGSLGTCPSNVCRTLYRVPASRHVLAATDPLKSRPCKWCGGVWQHARRSGAESLD